MSAIAHPETDRAALAQAGLQGSAMTLCYHAIAPGHPEWLYSLPVGRFEEHLSLIADLQRGAQPDILPPRVTFDDGHLSTYEYGLPLLQKYSVGAAFFLTGQWIETRGESMTWAQVRELVSLGHEVQSHGWSHVLLTHCSESELEDELRRSKKTLEDKLGIEVGALSFPGGRWNRRMLRACAKAGYNRAYGSQPWIHHAICEGVELRGRLPVHRTMGRKQLLEFCKSSDGALLGLRARGMVQEAVRLVLGDYLYIALWRVLTRERNI